MRDIKSYQEQFIKDDFERVQEKYRKKKIVEQLNRYKPNSILEIGCGVDSICSYYGDENTIYCIVEPSKEFCDNVQAADNITVINGLFEESVESLKDRQFDFIVLSSLLHEVECPQRLIEAVKQVCGTDTIVHINVPNNESFHVLMGVAMGVIARKEQLSEKAQALQQNTSYSLETLAEMLENQGFNVQEKGGYFMKPFTHKQMGEMLKSGIIDEKVTDALYDISKLFPNNGSEIFVNVKYKGNNYDREK